MFEAECLWATAYFGVHCCTESIQFRILRRIWVPSSKYRGSINLFRGACGRCFRIQGYQDPFNPMTILNMPSIVVKVTDSCPVQGNVQTLLPYPSLRTTRS